MCTNKWHLRDHNVNVPTIRVLSAAAKFTYTDKYLIHSRWSVRVLRYCATCAALEWRNISVMMGVWMLLIKQHKRINA